jgi:hypothetical protein
MEEQFEDKTWVTPMSKHGGNVMGDCQNKLEGFPKPLKLQ